MRFSESDYLGTTRLDFVPRERRYHTARLIGAYLLAISFVLVSGHLPSLAGSNYAVMAAIVIMVGICVYTVVNTQRNLDLVMDNEFQNLLYSQAVALGTSFVIFVRRNGTIVYANDGVKEVFGGDSYGEAQALEAVFERGRVSKADRERVMGAIFSNANDRIVFPVILPNGTEQKFILIVEPLARPSGYLVIRGRAYREARSGTEMLPNTLRATSPEKLDHMLSTTPIAHYATDAFGRVEYVNPALEALCGQSLDTILDARTQLSQLVEPRSKGPVAEDGTLAECAGEAALITATGERVICLFFQHLIRDEKGKTVGSTGSIIASPMLEHA